MRIRTIASLGLSGILAGVMTVSGALPATASPAASAGWQLIRLPVQVPPYALSVHTPTDVWTLSQPFLGGNGSLLDPVAADWNGGSWTSSALPQSLPGEGGTTYAKISGSASDAWIAGSVMPGPYHRRQPLVMHYNSATWSPILFPDDGVSDLLTDVASLGPADTWVAGTSQAGPGRPILMHWNGTTWASLTPPAPPGTQATGIQHVSAASPTDVWLLGTDTGGTTDGTFAAHWDGTAWSAIPVPRPASTNQSWSLTDLLALGPADVWAVGGVYDNQQVVTVAEVTLHWNGVSWQEVATPPLPNSAYSPNLSHIGGVPGNLWTVGAYWDTSANTSRVTVLRGDGTKWSADTEPTVANASGPVGVTPTGTVFLSGSDGQSGYLLQSTS